MNNSNTGNIHRSTPSAPPGKQGEGTLKQNSIGVLGMVGMVVAVTAPLTAAASNLAISIASGVGAGTVLLLVLVAVVLFVFTAGYTVLSRHVVNAGAYFAYIGYGLGRQSGAAAAFVACVAYSMATAAMLAATGFFVDIAVTAYVDVSVPWYLYSAGAAAVVALLCRRGVEVTKKVTSATSILQFLVIAVIGMAILVKRPGSFSLSVFDPSVLSTGNIALSLVFCFLCYSGFEATAIYGEEARRAKRSIAVATYVSLAALTVIFTFCAWAMVAAYSESDAAGDPSAAFFGIVGTYLGEWLNGPLSLLVAFSFGSTALAYHGMASRYMFALGRSRLLPATLGRAHPRFGSPYISGYAQTLISAVVILPYVIANADPFLNLFPAVAGIVAISLTALMIACCASIVCARATGKLPVQNSWSTLWAPSISGFAIGVIAVVIVTHYADVTGSDSAFVALMPGLPLFAGIYGAMVYRKQAQSRNIVLEDVLHE